MEQRVTINDPSENMLFAGVPEGYDCLVLSELAAKGDDVLFVLRDDKRTSAAAAGFVFFAPDIELIQLPAWDCLPYDRVSPKNDIVAQRIHGLTELLDNASGKGRIILVPISALLQRVPARSIFNDRILLVSQKRGLRRDKLVEFLEQNGYGRSDTVMDPSEFALRGSIVDLFPPGLDHPLRLDFFGDELESIRIFDSVSQLTIGKLDGFSLKPVREFAIDEHSIARFRTGYRALFGAVKRDDLLYESISNGRSYIGMEHWLPLFHTRLESILDYVPVGPVIFDHQIPDAFDARWKLITDCYDARSNMAREARAFSEIVYNPLPIDRLYIEKEELDSLLKDRPVLQLQPFSAPASTDSIADKGGKPGRNFSAARNKRDLNVFDVVRDYIGDEVQAGKRTLLACHSLGSRDRLISALKEHRLTVFPNNGDWKAAQAFSLDNVQAVILPLEFGFSAPGLNVICEQDILGDRLHNPASKKYKPGKFIVEASALNAGDLVVHAEHGIARFKELVTISIAGADHDCLTLNYHGDDKLFLPVENIDVISRYGQEGSEAQLDKLGGSAWQAKKSKLKLRVQEMATKLIAVAAARQLKDGEVYRLQQGIYDEFCAGFLFEETEDQAQAIRDVIDDLSSGQPMDRLICGDVGFGKTEIALRAAFVAAMEGKQVAVVVPTTLLARQHFLLFSERFTEFPIRVCQLSRLISNTDIKKTKQGIADGSVDIVIGTHALLAKDINFSRLGVLIVDEEQHFGVVHKERLKQLKSNVHVLTLTATPIPRTLQMALAGVREMSLIATPPVDRLAVRTFILPKDSMVLREAIQRERYRGGQIFYVCPRIKDIPRLHGELAKLVPDIKIAVAHGQLPPHRLEEVMTSFYGGRFDLLLSTNIVESGLDIPSVNTIIIHRADQFGLAQLYQLRGRIGRSKVRGYAYLTLPQNQKLTVTAQKRLEVMQALDSLGAGFMLASHDLDIRGAGNLLGEEQSGHIREIGIELYQKMLEEAVTKAKAPEGEQLSGENQWMPRIDLGIPVLIPADYISDIGIRLALYRRIAALENRSESDNFAVEMIDRFGPLPEEVENLLSTVIVKQLCRATGVEQLEAGSKGAIITFRNNHFENPAGLVEFITTQSDTAKLRPDHKLVYMRVWNEGADRLAGVQHLIQQLAKLVMPPVN